MQTKKLNYAAQLLRFYDFIQSGFTPLHLAAHYGSFDTAKLLIENEAEINYQAKVSLLLCVREQFKIVTVIKEIGCI